MGNFNIDIQLDKLPGARIQEVQGQTSKRLCVVIPIDNERGTVVDSYSKFDHKAGGVVWKPLQGVNLNLIAYEMKEAKFGQTHMLKANLSREVFTRMSEQQQKAMPIVGHLKPWQTTQAGMKAQEEEQDDLSW